MKVAVLIVAAIFATGATAAPMVGKQSTATQVTAKKKAKKGFWKSLARGSAFVAESIVLGAEP